MDKLIILDKLECTIVMKVQEVDLQLLLERVNKINESLLKIHSLNELHLARRPLSLTL